MIDNDWKEALLGLKIWVQLADKNKLTALDN